MSGSAEAVPVTARPGAFDGSVTMASLRSAAPASCPLGALPTAVRAAGLSAAEPPTGSVDPFGADLRATGVAARCDIRLTGGGSLQIMLVAADQPGAVIVTAPELQEDARLAVAQIRTLMDSALRLSPGQSVSIPGDAAVTLVIVSVTGARSAALLVAGRTGPTRDQTRAVALALTKG